MPLPNKLEIPLGLAVTYDDELSSVHEGVTRGLASLTPRANFVNDFIKAYRPTFQFPPALFTCP
jgi:hypothetical protein